MRSVLFTIGPVTVYSYGFMIAVGILSALFFSSRKFKKLGIDDEILYGLALIALIFGFLCAKLLYIVVEFRAFLYDPWGTLSGSGFVLYGGIIGGIGAAMVYCRRKKLDFMRYFDLLIPYVAMAQGFGRIGCFLAGCCYGAETDCFWGVTFHDSPFAPNGVPLIPTQLLSAAGDFLIMAVLLLYAKKEPARGKVSGLYLLLYSIGRFVIEFFRNDYRGSIGFLSTSQFISILIFFAGLALFFNVGKFIKNRQE